MSEGRHGRGHGHGHRRFGGGVALCAGLCLVATPAAAEPCTLGEDVPRLRITEVADTAVPVVDEWQVVWGKVPLSDAQVAQLAGRDAFIERTREEMELRGTWVFAGLAIAAVGTAVSSVGWVLYGQDDLDQGVTLPLAAGGLLVGILGVLITTENIQTPLEPHLAPTPRHRLSRVEMQGLVREVNRTLYGEDCAPAAETEAATAAEESVP